MNKIEFANLLKPEHSYSNCSDEDTCNGFGSTTITHSEMKRDENGLVWRSDPQHVAFFTCPRCAIIEILHADINVQEISTIAKKYLESSSMHDVVVAAIRFTEQ